MNNETRLEIFRKASLCRNFEEVVYSYIEKKTFKFPIYLSAGQEFIAATLATFYKNLNPAIFAQHRCHHTYLSFGGDMAELILELLGKEEGCCKGMGGSASIQSKQIKMYGHDGLMGSQVPIALGYAIASKNPTFTFMGDASGEEDYVMSSIAWSNHKKAPILFIVEDNNLSILTKKNVRRNWEHKNFAESVNVTSYDIDDNPLTIWHTLKKIKTNFPALLNIKTERLFWHAGAGVDNYPKFDRYQFEMEALGTEAKNIHAETRYLIEKLWQQHLEK